MDPLVELNTECAYYSLPLAAKQLGNIDRLPKSMKVLLENLLRHVDGDTVQVDDLKAIVGWLQTGHADREIAYRPARVLMQDFTGVPAVVEQCGRAGVKGLVVATAGFADDGAEGLARQRSLVRLARENGMRLVGPASLGLANTDPAISLNASMAVGISLYEISRQRAVKG